MSATSVESPDPGVGDVSGVGVVEELVGIVLAADGAPLLHLVDDLDPLFTIPIWKREVDASHGHDSFPVPGAALAYGGHHSERSVLRQQR